MNRLRSDFTGWYSVALWKMGNCQNSCRVKSKMEDDAQIFKYGPNVFGTSKARYFKFGVHVDDNE